MFLQPKKMKYKKWHKLRPKGNDLRGSEVAFGSFGLKAMESKWIKASQIESARKIILKALKKKGELWIRIFPYKPVTSKGTEFPMGGGKGAVSHYVCPIRAGKVIFELDDVKESEAVEILGAAANKFPIKTKFVKR